MKKIIQLLGIAMLFTMFTACTTSKDIELSSSTGEGQTQAKEFEFNENEPQYYMSRNSAASKDGYYYVCEEVMAYESLKYLYFYDISQGTEYPVCSKLTCEHNDDTCDAHILVKDIVADSIWYYKERLYMVERSAEQDMLVSYNLKGRDKKQHVNLIVNGASVFAQDGGYTGYKTKAMAFNSGYLYYYVLDTATEVNCYRVSIESGSAPELIKSYPKEGVMPKLSLHAVADKIYITYTLKDYATNSNSYNLTCYDTQTKKSIEYSQAELLQQNNNEEIYAFDSQVHFDEKGNMYYVTLTATEYNVNKMNLATKSVERIYTVKGEMLASSGFVASDENYIELISYDGKYLYLWKGVNGNKKTNDFKGEVINYGVDNSLTLTTKVNHTYIYVLDENGICVDVLSLKRVADAGNRKNPPCLMLPVAFVCGDERALLANVGSHMIDKLELTNSKYIDIYNASIEESKKNPTKHLNTNIRIILSKSDITTTGHLWQNLANRQFRHLTNFN